MEIHANFTGGNITLIKQEGNTVYLNNQLRDTTRDWFYWAFCVEGAEGLELTFHLGKTRLGYWGPAVSHDLRSWHWLDSVNDDSFNYKFGKEENRVYFAHNMLYHPDRFFEFAKELSLNTFELCKSRKGRSVPAFTMGNGSKNIILTARHHACESTGSYVLEGVLRELMNNPVSDSKVFCVPFVDYDGVIDGDQGKARAPHDHNRDYEKGVSVYPETAAIKQFAEQYGCNFGFDFHSPYHRGGENDRIFLVRNSKKKLDRIERFSKMFEDEISEGSMKYSSSNDHPPETTWNMPSANFGLTMTNRPECYLALSLETAYFGTEDNKISPERMLELGKCYARTIKKYIESVE